MKDRKGRVNGGKWGDLPEQLVTCGMSDYKKNRTHYLQLHSLSNTHTH